MQCGPHGRDAGGPGGYGDRRGTCRQHGSRRWGSSGNAGFDSQKKCCRRMRLSAIPLLLMPVVKSPPAPPLKISKRCAGRYPIFLYLCVEGTVTHYDKIPESSTAVYMSSMDKDTLITLLNRLLSSFFLMTAPNTAHVDVATNAVRVKLTADNER